MSENDQMMEQNLYSAMSFVHSRLMDALSLRSGRAARNPMISDIGD